MISGCLPRQPGGAEKKTSLAAILKAQFKRVADAITRTVEQKRQKEKETRGGFVVAFRKIMARIRRTEVQPQQQRYETERLWLSDTLDWHRLWHQESVYQPELSDDPTRPDSFGPSDDFSPNM